MSHCGGGFLLTWPLVCHRVTKSYHEPPPSALATVLFCTACGQGDKRGQIMKKSVSEAVGVSCSFFLLLTLYLFSKHYSTKVRDGADQRGAYDCSDGCRGLLVGKTVRVNRSGGGTWKKKVIKKVIS